jgi:cellulose biosynthesis protein BcsQ
MDKSEIIDLTVKIIVGVVSALACAGIAVIWRSWRRKSRQIAELTRRGNENRVEFLHLEKKYELLVDERDRYKSDSANLQARAEASKQLWARNVQAKFAELRDQYQGIANLKQRALIQSEVAQARLSARVDELSMAATDLTGQKASVEVENAQLRAELRDIVRRFDDAAAEIEHRKTIECGLTQELESAANRLASEEARRSASDIEIAGLNARLAATEEIRDQLNADLTALKAELDDAKEQMDQILKFDGRLWTRPVPADVPAFRPYANRRMPIISVLNFKGGVGKTTITANLAATLSNRGNRTLLIDLDYQRSLSQMMLSDETRKMSRLERRCLQHFLSGDRYDTEWFLDFPKSVETGIDHCRILPNSNAPIVKNREDSLEETENQLMAEWVLKKEAMPDIRFFLRSALHGVGIESHYQYVFLDCPPRLTTATINALAASDFVLIPVILDVVSTNSILPLLDMIKQFRNLFPELQVLGVVANHVKLHRGSLIKRQAEVWRDVQLQCNGFWKESPICFFETLIPDLAVGTNGRKTANKLAIADSDNRDLFETLTSEFLKETERHEHAHSSTILG